MAVVEVGIEFRAVLGQYLISPAKARTKHLPAKSKRAPEPDGKA